MDYLDYLDYGSDGAGSPEQASPIHKTTNSNRTSQPVRKSAGKLKAKDGYVDSKTIDNGLDDEYEDEDEDMSETPSEGGDSRVKLRQKRKRKRSPSPTPPPLDRVVQLEGPDELSDIEDTLRRKSNPPPVRLQFNIPLGFHGPLYVTIDRSMLGLDKAYDMRPRRAIKAPGHASNTQLVQEKKPLSFTDFPAELRNKFYRMLFVTEDVLCIPADRTTANKDSLKRSSQFLRTCKLIHREGCSILYGENSFYFDRNPNTRGSFWEPFPKEIGYKDLRMFLQVIGTENLLYLRDITLKFQDAMPGVTPGIEQSKRRYVQDGHLLHVLRILRQTQLRSLNVIFQGRRQLSHADIKFLEYLMQVKADHVDSILASSWHSQKIENNLWPELRGVMTRDEPLYLET
ncbi:hypothetical protein GRF29_96g392781 [Pseudopithomyces chartarum]|uniref:Uncharacterized protein n=1 Tax=Pseudopithomyces chartarum TaxID=1892770 RepID=A0AAN6LUY6_9PLEO|nr:hypothetical protein GRF29_96g392781 [Pseudopithomyces chartarum]